MNVVLPGTLDLFSRPAVQLAVLERNTQEFRPVVAQAKVDNPVEFIIHSGSDEMLDLSETRMRMKLKLDVNKIKNSDNKKENMTQGEWQKIWPVANILNSIWKQIDIQINDRPVTNSQQMHAFKAYLDTLTGFSSDSKKGFLSASGWVDQEYTSTGEETASGREEWLLPSPGTLNTSKEIQFYGPLNSELLYQGRALVAGSRLKITCIPQTNPGFYIKNLNGNSTHTYTITPVIEDLVLEMTTLKIESKALEAQKTMLKTVPAVYPFTRSEVKVFNIPSGKTYYNIAQVQSGTLPSRALVCFIPNKALVGDFATNPFKFAHQNLSYLCFHKNGKMFPQQPFKPDFTKGLDMREMLSVYTTLREATTDSCMTINRKDWRDHSMVLGVNFTPECSAGCLSEGHVNEDDKGTLSLELQFSAATTDMYALVYLEYESTLEIHGTGEVKTSWL